MLFIKIIVVISTDRRSHQCSMSCRCNFGGSLRSQTFCQGFIQGKKVEKPWFRGKKSSLERQSLQLICLFTDRVYIHFFFSPRCSIYVAFVICVFSIINLMQTIKINYHQIIIFVYPLALKIFFMQKVCKTQYSSFYCTMMALF